MYDYSYYDNVSSGFPSGIFAAFGGMMLFSSLIGIFTSKLPLTNLDT